MPDTHRRHCRSAGRRRQHAGRRTPWSGQPPASRFRCRRGHRMRRPGSTAVAGGRAGTVGRRRPPGPALLRGLRPCPRRMAAVRPAPGPQSRTHGGHCRGVRFCGRPWVAARSAQPADIGGPNLRPRTWPVDTGSPQAAGPCGHPRRRQGYADAAAAAGWTAGTRTVHCRLHVRPGTGPQAAAPANTAMAIPPDRSLVLYVHAVRLSAVCAAQLRCPIQPVIPGAAWCWLVD